MSAYTSRNGAAIRASIHELASLMEDIDAEDALVYLPMHSEMDWERQLDVRWTQELRAQWDGIGREQ